MDNDRFQSSFSEMLRNYPLAIEERRKFVGLMRDLFPEDQMRVNLIIVAFDLGIAEEIVKASSIDSSIVTRYGKQMVRGHGISSENAEWAVSIWCVCYGKDVLGKTIDPNVTVPAYDGQAQTHTMVSSKTQAEDQEKSQKLTTVLNSIGISVEVARVSHGPENTFFDLKSEQGIKITKVSSQSEYIANSMGVQYVRVLPSKFIGAFACVVVPNDDIEEVSLVDLLNVDAVKNNPSPTAVVLGVDDAGNCVVVDITEMHHILIVGQTGSGKTACISTIITALIHRSYSEEVRLLLIDPRGVELYIYNDDPHLVCPVVTDPKKALSALDWAVTEMTKRYKLFAERGVRDIRGYNNTLKLGEREMPQMVIVIEELADLMSTSAKETTEAINMLTLRSSNAGIHLIISTNRTSGRILVKDIRDNMPCRIAFALPSANDSRTVINAAGAEKLRGKGDMLIKHVGRDIPLHVWGAWISDEDIRTTIASGRTDDQEYYEYDVLGHQEDSCFPSDLDELTEEDDPRLSEAVDVVMELGQVSISMLQRRMRIGYARAGRLIDAMSRLGIVTEADGSKPRSSLVSPEQARRILGNSGEVSVPSSHPNYQSQQNQEANRMQEEIDRLRREFYQARSDVEQYPLSRRTTQEIDRAQGILDGMQDGLDKATTALEWHEEYKRKLEEEKKRRIEDAKNSGKSGQYEIDMIVVLLNEENLGYLHRDDDEFAKVYADDFPLYTSQQIKRLRGSVMPTIHDQGVIETAKTNMLSRPVKDRFAVSTGNHFNVNRDWDLERRCKKAIHDTRMWYRDAELDELRKLMEKHKAEAYNSVIDQLNGFKKGWSDFKQAKRDLKIKIEDSHEDIPESRNLFEVELKHGVYVGIRLEHKSLGYLFIPIMNVFASVWGVNPEDIWEAALRNPIEDARVISGNSRADAQAAKSKALMASSSNRTQSTRAEDRYTPEANLRFQKLEVVDGNEISVIGNHITLHLQVGGKYGTPLLIFHANNVVGLTIKTPRLFSRKAFICFEFGDSMNTSGILDEELRLLKHKLKWLKGTELAIPYFPEDKEAAMNFMSKIAEDLDLELEEI